MPENKICEYLNELDISTEEKNAIAENVYYYPGYFAKNHHD
jgi:hypothetical protein